MTKLYFIITCFLIFACTTMNYENNSSYEETEIKKMVKNHGQDITLVLLQEYLSSAKINETNKDFIRFYVYKYVDDPILHSFINKEVISRKTDNIYSFLLNANKTNDSTVYNLNFQKAKNIDENNIYVLIEIIYSSVDLKERNKCIRELSKLAFNNDLVLTLNITESRLNQDTLNYFTYFNILKKQHDNYYSNFIVASEYHYQSKVDSAILFYKRSIKQKENIGACLNLSELFFQVYGNEKLSDYYLDKAITINEKDEEVLSFMAWRCFDKKDSLNARKNFDKLIGINPTIEHKEDYLLFLLCTNQLEKGKAYYSSNIEKHIPSELKSAYYLVFETLKKEKDINKFSQIGDSIEKLHGLAPIEYSNRMMNVVLKSIYKWQ